MALANILNSDAFTIASSSVDQKFRVLVGLPDEYDRSPSESGPVIYTLDADGAMGLMTDMARMLGLGGEIPSATVVGIGYPVQSYMQTLPMRFRDMTPTSDDKAAKELLRQLGSNEGEYVGTGGAAGFLRFVVDELIPQIETRYNIESTRNVLWGGSLGGLFALYALVSGAPFDGYIISSPALWWDDCVINSLLDGSQAKPKTDRVMLSVGSLEGFSEPITQLAAAIEGKWPTIGMSTVEFADETHLSCQAPSVGRGLRWVLPPSIE